MKTETRCEKCGGPTGDAWRKRRCAECAETCLRAARETHMNAKDAVSVAERRYKDAEDAHHKAVGRADWRYTNDARSDALISLGAAHAALYAAGDELDHLLGNP